MWEWTLNWDQVRDDLLIGSCPMTGDDIERIRDQSGASALLSLQSDICRRAFGIDWEELRASGEKLDLAMVNAPMLDFDPPDQRRSLPRAVACLRDLLAAGHRVYLHCTAGCNRSPLAALGYLTFVEMQPPDAAMALLKQGRPQSDPSWEAYDGCRADLVDVLRENIMVRAYYLSQEIPGDDAQTHWVRAEAETIRAAFVNGRASSHGRLDPSRE
ncbi:MAG TPA: dual specificity protein phosphatase family protein [Rhodospirillales bacterium]|nr:dual specificity protein phosphatase family protein [Rhodospirillales bacterium]